MKSDGIVKLTAKGSDLVVVEHGDGFSVLELLGAEVDTGDILHADWSALATETIHNKTKGEHFAGFLQGTWSSMSEAAEIIR